MKRRRESENYVGCCVDGLRLMGSVDEEDDDAVLSLGDGYDDER